MGDIVRVLTDDLPENGSVQLSCIEGTLKERGE